MEALPVVKPFLGIEPLVIGVTTDPKLFPEFGFDPVSNTPIISRMPASISDLRITLLNGREILQAKVTGSEEWLQIGPLLDIPAGTKLYTWAPKDDAERWKKNGIVDADEMKWLVTNGDGAAGGGFYASLSPIDSIAFGEYLIEQRTRSTVKMLNFMQLGLMKKKSQYNPVAGVLQSPEMIEKLRTLGIVGLRYTETWTNWIDNPKSVLAEAKMISEFQDIEPVLLEIQKTRPELVSTYSELLNTMVRLYTPTNQQQSFISRLSNFGFTIEQFKNGLGIPRLALPENEKGQEYAPPGLRKLIEEMSPYLEKRVDSLSEDISSALAAPLSIEQLKKILGITINQTQFPYAELGFSGTMSERVHEVGLIALSGVALPKSMQDQSEAVLQWPQRESTNSLNEDSFPSRLLKATQFIDLPDLAVSMATGSSLPWAAYDRPRDSTLLLEKWKKVESELIALRSTVPLGGTAIGDVLKKAATILSEGRIVGVRDTDIWAGGDLYPDSHGGYYRATQNQLKVLKENAFLTLHSKPDPESRAENPTFLVRHRYLSVQDYRKIQALLSPELLIEIQAAEAKGIFNKPNAEAYKSLTSRLIEEVLSSLSKSTDGSSMIRFPSYLNKFTTAVSLRVLMSIHPFSDYNGRSIRAVLSINNGPMFLPDWNDDLMTPLLVLANRLESGTKAIQFIQNGLLREQQAHPAFPKYYDIPEWYQVLAGVPEIQGDPAEFVRKMKNILLKPETRELIRQKRFSELRFPGVCEQNLYPKH